MRRCTCGGPGRACDHSISEGRASALGLATDGYAALDLFVPSAFIAERHCFLTKRLLICLECLLCLRVSRFCRVHIDIQTAQLPKHAIGRAHDPTPVPRLRRSTHPFLKRDNSYSHAELRATIWASEAGKHSELCGAAGRSTTTTTTVWRYAPSARLCYGAHTVLT
jgi:hypothetical protein